MRLKLPLPPPLPPVLPPPTSLPPSPLTSHPPRGRFETEGHCEMTYCRANKASAAITTLPTPASYSRAELPTTPAPYPAPIYPHTQSTPPTQPLPPQPTPTHPLSTYPTQPNQNSTQPQPSTTLITLELQFRFVALIIRKTRRWPSKVSTHFPIFV